MIIENNVTEGKQGHSEEKKIMGHRLYNAGRSRNI